MNGKQRVSPREQVFAHRIRRLSVEEIDLVSGADEYQQQTHTLADSSQKAVGGGDNQVRRTV